MKLLSVFKQKKPGAIYAFTKGIYSAKMFVLIFSEKNNLNFLILPDNLPISFNKNEFRYYITTKTCEYIENLPDFVFNVCKAQYLKNITCSINNSNESTV